MTDRYNALIVVLEHDMRDDDAVSLISAIKQMRGVLSVQGNVRNIERHVAESRIREELGSKLLNIIYPDFRPQ